MIFFRTKTATEDTAAPTKARPVRSGSEDPFHRRLEKLDRANRRPMAGRVSPFASIKSLRQLQEV